MIKSEHVRLEAAATVVTLTATNKTIGEIQVAVPTSVDEVGDVVVSSTRFDGIVASFSAATKISISSKPSSVEIAGRNSVCKIASLPANEMLPTFKTDGIILGTIELTGNDVGELLDTAVAANRDERTRRSLCGVCLSNAGDVTAFTATNGLFLSTINVPGKFLPEEDRSCILPLPAIAVLRSLTSRIKVEMLRVQRSRSLITFETAAFRFSSPLIDGVFPACQHLIPKNADSSRVFIDRSALLASLQRMQAAATTPIPLVTLIWNDGGETVNLSLTREPTTAVDALSCETSGSESITLHLEQLVRLLTSLNCSAVILETAGSQPLVMRGDDRLLLLVRSSWEGKEEIAA